MAPCEPPLFSQEQVNPSCHPHMGGINLSRPRDFVSALSKDRDSSVACSSGENSQTSTTSWEHSSRDQSPSQTQANSDTSGHTSTHMTSEASKYHLGTQPEDQCPLMSTVTLEFSDYGFTSSAGRHEDLNQNEEVYSETDETEKRDR